MHMTTPTLQLNVKIRLVMQTDRQKVVNTEYAQLGTRELSQRVMEEANANPWLRPGWFDARESGSAGRNDGRAPWHRSGTDLAARGKAPPLDEQPAPRSLHDELERQLLESRLSDCELRVGMAIVHSIDDNGLLTESVASLARMLSVPVEDVSAVLACVQGFDPAGVGAHNATEAILIQLRQLPSGTRWQREAIAVLTDHAGLVEARQFADVRRRMNLDAEALEAVFRLIRRQRLRPGAGFASAPTEFAIPEVLVRKIDRGWTVSS